MISQGASPALLDCACHLSPTSCRHIKKLDRINMPDLLLCLPNLFSPTSQFSRLQPLASTLFNFEIKQRR